MGVPPGVPYSVLSQSPPHFPHLLIIRSSVTSTYLHMHYSPIRYIPNLVQSRSAVAWTRILTLTYWPEHNTTSVSPPFVPLTSGTIFTRLLTYSYYGSDIRVHGLLCALRAVDRQSAGGSAHDR